MEKYSVLMSVYAKAKPKELATSIQSMLDQTYKPNEFVLVWDGPVGNDLKEVVSAFSQDNPGMFTIVQLPENHGLAYALNVGINASRNELLARMDSDDYSMPDRCEKQVKAFENDKELMLLGTNIGFFEDNPFCELPIKRSYPTDLETIKKILRRNDPFSHPTVMYRKEAVLSCGGYDPELRRRQDYDLFSRMVVNKGYKAANLPDKLLLFRADDDYALRNKNRESCNNRILIQKRIYKRGDCGFVDYMYVLIAMNISKAIPNKLYKVIYRIIKG